MDSARRAEGAGCCVRRLLAGETLTHHGEHYTFEEYTLADLPIQDPASLLSGVVAPQRFFEQDFDTFRPVIAALAGRRT
jgi:alkanesulfonate monooxygenase SsuD/methylene tetrahydromethanopterin reductase-like flavin-dependent oxidoreductase (luciferase family)